MNDILSFEPMKNLFIVCILIISGMGIAKTPCHPLPNFFQTQMIIGYGSLMYEPSKRKTVAKVSKNHPIFLKHFERRWNYQTDKGTYLGLKANPKSQISAVYFKVSPLKLFFFDKRERNYCRILVDTRNFIPLTGQASFPKGQYWLYIPKKPSEKTIRIQQYYLRYFIKGCKKIAQDYQNPVFFKSCLKIIPKKSRNL
jgi:hypothetical protein